MDTIKRETRSGIKALPKCDQCAVAYVPRSIKANELDTAELSGERRASSQEAEPEREMLSRT
jgi:hypothetical protein